MSTATRIEVKDYYRKSAGFMSFMESVLMLATACIAFYAAENFTTLVSGSTDTENNMISVYYLIVFGALFAMCFSAIVGIAGMRGNSDENFRNQRISSIVCGVVDILYIINTIFVLTKDGYSVDDAFNLSIFLIGIGVTVAGIIYAVFVTLMTKSAEKYCDIKKHKAIDVPQGMEKEILEKRRTAVLLSAVALISMTVWLLCWYFERQIVQFDAGLAEDNSTDSMIFKLIAIIGTVGVAYMAAATFALIKNKAAAYVLTKQSIIYSGVVMIIFVVFSILKLGADYVKTGYPALEYIIFAYVLIAFCVVTGVFTYGRISKQ